jgi:hypothetical protein
MKPPQILLAENDLGELVNYQHLALSWEEQPNAPS